MIVAAVTAERLMFISECLCLNCQSGNGHIERVRLGRAVEVNCCRCITATFMSTSGEGFTLAFSFAAGCNTYFVSGLISSKKKFLGCYLLQRRNYIYCKLELDFEANSFVALQGLTSCCSIRFAYCHTS